MLRRMLTTLAVMGCIGAAPAAAQGFEWGLELSKFDAGDIKPRHTLSWIGDEWFLGLHPALTAGTFVVEYPDSDAYDEVYALVGLRGHLARAWGQVQVGWDAEYWATMDAETSDEGAMEQPGPLVAISAGHVIVGPVNVVGRALFDLRSGFNVLGLSFGAVLDL